MPPSLPGDDALLLRLRPRQLLLLAKLDAHRHLGRAAQAMHISQPAATKLLQQLEDTLGQALFTRLARGMEPTACGDVLIRYARRVSAELAATRDELQALGSGLRGALRVGSVPGAIPDLLAPALVAYGQQHPLVVVSVVVDTSDVMRQQLDRGDVELMLGRLTEGHDGERFQAVPLLEESMVVVVRVGHPVLAAGSATLADMAHWGWVLQPPGSPQRGRLEAAMRAEGIGVRLNFIETASPIMTTALLERSDMAAMLPASQAAHYARLGVLCVAPVALPVQVPPIALITCRDRVLSPAALQLRLQLLGATPPA